MNMNMSNMEMIFIFGLMMFLTVKSHFMMSLLYLEMLSMSLFFLILCPSQSTNESMMIMFLCMMVLEGAFGLSLIVKESRKSGGDFLTFSNEV